MVGPAAQRTAVAYARDGHGLSQRRACSIIDADRASDGLRGTVIVAGEHDRLHAERAQVGDGLDGFRTLAVAHAKGGNGTGGIAQRHCGHAFRLQAVDCAAPGRRIEAAFGHQRGLTTEIHKPGQSKRKDDIPQRA